MYRGLYKNRAYNPVVPLTIYRRHSVDCRVHKLGLKAYEKKYFKDCDCPIWLKGTTDQEQYPRQALGVRDGSGRGKAPVAECREQGRRAGAPARIGLRRREIAAMEVEINFDLSRWVLRQTCRTRRKTKCG